MAYISTADVFDAGQGYQGGGGGPGFFAGLGGLFGRLRNGLGKFSFDPRSAYGKFNTAYQGVTNNPFWTKAGGIDGLGKLANVGGAVVQGGKAIGNLVSADQAQSNYDDLAKDIRMTAAANPLAYSNMSMADKKLLRQIKSGTSKNNFGNIMTGVTKGLPKILGNTALGFVTGGIPGAIIQGAGTAVNKGIEGYTSGTEESQGQLQALYDKLLQSEQEYNMMKRPTNLIGSGLQSRYMNQLW